MRAVGMGSIDTETSGVEDRRDEEVGKGVEEETDNGGREAAHVHTGERDEAEI